MAGCGYLLGDGVAADGADLLLAAGIRAGRLDGGLPVAVAVLAGCNMLVKIKGELMCLLCQSCTLGGGVYLSRCRVHTADGGLHLADLVVALCLHLGKLCADECVVLIGALIGQSEVAQTVNGPVVAGLPALGQDLVAAALPADRGECAVEAVGLFCREACASEAADLVALVHVGGQNGQVRNCNGVLAVLHCKPLNGGCLHGAGGLDLEDVPLEIAGVADTVDLVEVDHILCAEILGRFDSGSHGDDLAVLDIGDGKVGAYGVCGGELLAACEVVKAVYHAGIDAGVGVGGTEVDGVLGLIADIGSGLLCDLDDLIRCDDILGVVKVDKADSAHVRADGDHVGGELDRNVLVAGVVFDIPDFLLVADENARALLGTDSVVNVHQQLNALFSGACFAEENSGHVTFAHAAADHRVKRLEVAVALPAERDHCGNGNALLVRAALLHRGVCVRSVAVGAHAAEIIVGNGGVGVAIVAEGVGKAVAAFVYAACGMLAVLAYISDLVVAVGVVLASRHEGGAVGREIRADIYHRAGRSTADTDRSDRCNGHCANHKLLFEVHVDFSFR